LDKGAADANPGILHTTRRLLERDHFHLANIHAIKARVLPVQIWSTHTVAVQNGAQPRLRLFRTRDDGLVSVMCQRIGVSTRSLIGCVQAIPEACHGRSDTSASLVGGLGELVCNYVVAYRRQPSEYMGSA
jgi:phage tail protein X